MKVTYVHDIRGALNVYVDNADLHVDPTAAGSDTCIFNWILCSSCVIVVVLELCNKGTIYYIQRSIGCGPVVTEVTRGKISVPRKQDLTT